jgi:hypothetical protein
VRIDWVRIEADASTKIISLPDDDDDVHQARKWILVLPLVWVRTPSIPTYYQPFTYLSTYRNAYIPKSSTSFIQGVYTIRQGNNLGTSIAIYSHFSPTYLPTYRDTDIPQRCISFIQGIDTIRQGDDFGTSIGLRIDQLGEEVSISLDRNRLNVL